MSNAAADSFSLLDFAPKGSYLEEDDEAPMLFAVWYPTDDGDFDILGAGATASEAIEDARKQVRLWESNSRW